MVVFEKSSFDIVAKSIKFEATLTRSYRQIPTIEEALRT